MVVGASLLLARQRDATTGTLSVAEEVGWSFGYKTPHTTLLYQTNGIYVRLRRWLEVGVELDLLVPVDAFNKTAGLGIRPTARFYPVQRQTWGVYVESGGGLVYNASARTSMA